MKSKCRISALSLRCLVHLAMVPFNVTRRESLPPITGSDTVRDYTRLAPNLAPSKHKFESLNLYGNSGILVL